MDVPVMNIRPLVEILEYFSSEMCDSIVILRCWSKAIGIIPRPLWGPFLALALFLSEIESTIVQVIICEHKLAIPTHFQPPLSISTQWPQSNAFQGQCNASLAESNSPDLLMLWPVRCLACEYNTASPNVFVFEFSSSSIE